METWPNQWSLRPKDKADKPSKLADDPGNPTVAFRGEKRTNEMHQSKTDPDARLFRKSNSTGVVLRNLRHPLMENRNGMVDTEAGQARGKAEREMAQQMVARAPGWSPITAGDDQGCDTRDFVGKLRVVAERRHVAQNTSDHSSSIDDRTTRNDGYAISQRKQQLAEQIFGWMKTPGGMRSTRHRGKPPVRWMFKLTAAAYNLVRILYLLMEAG